MTSFYCGFQKFPEMVSHPANLREGVHGGSETRTRNHYFGKTVPGGLKPGPGGIFFEKPDPELHR